MAHRFISPFGFGPLGTPRPISDLPGDELHDPELQAAFNLDPVSNEKPIIQVVSFVEQRLIEELHKHPDLFKDMDRRRFEEIVAELFDGFGYAVELTKRTRDGGKDVIAIKRAEVDVRFLISKGIRTRDERDHRNHDPFHTGREAPRRKAPMGARAQGLRGSEGMGCRLPSDQRQMTTVYPFAEYRLHRS